MIDIRLAREHPRELRQALERKGAGELLDQLLLADASWRELTAAVDELRGRTRPKAKPGPEELVRLQADKDRLKGAEAELAEASEHRAELLGNIPNPPLADVPDGTTDDDAVELRRVGEPPRFDFEVKDHVALGGFDLDRGARVAGSRFVYRMGKVALLELALYRYALDHLVGRGFEPVLPPVMVREEAMYGTGFLPTEEPNLYRVEPDGLYLTGTSEVALASIHAGELLDLAEVPRRYAGYSTCFRREAGAAGRDTRGVFRVHQFDKVEMYSYVEPADSAAEHERIVAIEEEIVGSLGLAYRVVNTAAGDLGPSAAKKYDIEAWIPSQERYREITSCSNTTDYQARRLHARYRDSRGQPRVLHTLNGTAMTARFLIALMESNQNAAGAVTVPELLWRYGAPEALDPRPG